MEQRPSPMQTPQRDCDGNINDAGRVERAGRETHRVSIWPTCDVAAAWTIAADRRKEVKYAHPGRR